MSKSTTMHPLPHFTLEPDKTRGEQQTKGQRPTIVRYALALVVCFLVMATPLTRMAGTRVQIGRPTNMFILLPGAWLPLNLGFSGPIQAAEMATHIIFFMLLVVVAFVIYAGAAYTLWRQDTPVSLRTTVYWIWLTALVCGVILALTPAMLSHDIFSYSSYGRMLAIYHANPYFTPFTDFPHDPFYPLNDWKQVPSAYGPIWQGVSTLIAFCSGSQPAVSLIIYQFLGVALHLCNTLLVIAILRTLKRSARTIALGALLYAWNPLNLVESCLNGHNDALFITFLLLGLWFAAQIEQSTQVTQKLQRRHALFALLALTFAVLVKFTAAPLLALFLVFLARRAFLSVPLYAPERQRWLAALWTICLMGLLSGIVILGLYGPFWLGQSMQAIIASFTRTPAASLAYGSILRALADWAEAYGKPTSGLSGLFFSVFLERNTWDILNSFALGICMLLSIFWIWRTPTTRTLALATISGLGTVLLITPWFFPWYVTWLVALAAVALPVSDERLSRALFGGSLIFSASAFCIYLYMRHVPPIGGWVGLACLTTILPPILAFCLLLRFPLLHRQKDIYPEG